MAMTVGVRRGFNSHHSPQVLSFFLRPRQFASKARVLRREISIDTVSALTFAYGNSRTFLHRPTDGVPSFRNTGFLGQARSFSAFATGVEQQEKTIESCVVSTEWLHDHLGSSNLKVLDASWYMPNDKRNPLEEFKTCRIPGAIFFDIDGVLDPTSDLPHMLPLEEAFAAAVSALGIQNSDKIVVYDGAGLFSAARVWWMFRIFGHDNIAVLDGGLPKWHSSGYKVDTGSSEEVLARIRTSSESVKNIYQNKQVDPITFKTSFQPHLVWSSEQVRQNLKERSFQHIDARNKARFDGIVPEPRKGIRGGHVPGSKCVPFGEVLLKGQTLLPESELAEKFKEGGISLDAPIVASCGTGITACVLALALHRLGKKDVAVYDGSWTEWGGLPDTPVVTNKVES